MEEGEWMEAWKSHFTVLHVGRIVVQPSWMEYEPAAGEVVIAMDPGMAFGTGHHPTTRMCLAELDRLVKPGMSVLDVGTGSGILTIAAAKLGAGRIHALDVDAVAIRAAPRQRARQQPAANRATRTARPERGRRAAGRVRSCHRQPLHQRHREPGECAGGARAGRWAARRERHHGRAARARWSLPWTQRAARSCARNARATGPRWWRARAEVSRASLLRRPRLHTGRARLRGRRSRQAGVAGVAAARRGAHRPAGRNGRGVRGVAPQRIAVPAGGRCCLREPLGRASRTFS